MGGSTAPEPREASSPDAFGRILTAAVTLLVPVGLLVALLVVVDHDPVRTVTASRSPFSDEGWSVMNARNLVRLGTWAPDDWHLYLVNLPFSLLEAVSFQVLGVGIVQARLVSVVATVVTAGALAVGLRQPFGRVPAIVAAIAFATSTLVLFYGHLALLEPLVTACLTTGLVLVGRATGGHPGRWGIVAGLVLAIAVGSKPNAALPVAGILVGVALVGIRSDAAIRRWLAVSVVAIGACGIGWLALVGIPRSSLVAADIRIWPAQQLPESLGALLRRITRYPVSSDGAFSAIAPVGLGGLIGTAASLVGWRQLDVTGRRLVSASLGWVALGFAPLFILSYHPNRYVEPLIPAMAILLAAGLSAGWPAFSRRRRPAARAAAVAGLIALLAAPGAIAYATWLGDGTRTLVTTQAELARTIPPGAVIEGDLAPLFAMTTSAQTIVEWSHAGVNVGDQYADRGVRWLLVAPDEPPGWVSRHPAAWAGSERRWCVTWGAEQACLFALP